MRENSSGSDALSAPMTIVLKAFIIWLGILLIAIANGLLREAVLVPGVGTAAALPLSGLLLSGFILAGVYLSLPWLNIGRSLSLYLVGTGWVVLTLAFEFSFGLWQGKSWSEMLEAYTFKDGNLWPVVLLVTVCAPAIAAKLRQRF